MVGIKADLKFLMDFLKRSDALAYSTTTFVQGKTMRWGLAWTFDAKWVSLLQPKKSPAGVPVKLQLNCSCSIIDFVLKVKRLLLDLNFRFLVNNSELVEVIGVTNSWSNQRRKRRAAARNHVSTAISDPKRVKMSEDSVSADGDFPPANLKDYEGKSFALHCEIAFSDGESGTAKIVEIKHLGGTLGISAVHQVLQYLKNIYTKHTCASSN